MQFIWRLHFKLVKYAAISSFSFVILLMRLPYADKRGCIPYQCQTWRVPEIAVQRRKGGSRVEFTKWSEYAPYIRIFSILDMSIVIHQLKSFLLNNKKSVISNDHAIKKISMCNESVFTLFNEEYRMQNEGVPLAFQGK